MGKTIKKELAVLDDNALLKLANDMHKAGLLPKEMTPQQAFIIGQKGRELGIPGTEAMTAIYVIQGKPQLKAELQLKLAIERIPGFGYDILEYTEKNVKIKYYRAGRKPFIFDYSMEKAIKTGASTVSPKNGTQYTKDQWRKRPDYMLFNRNVTEALKLYAPDYTSEILYEFDENETKQALVNVVKEEKEDTPSFTEREVIINSIIQSLLGKNEEDKTQAEKELRDITSFKDKSGKEIMVNSFEELQSVSDSWLDRIYEKTREGI